MNKIGVYRYTKDLFYWQLGTDDSSFYVAKGFLHRNSKVATLERGNDDVIYHM